jgi:hypothetical protein
MIYPPNQKPPIWSIDPGIVAYNCQKAGLPHPVLAMPFWEKGGDRALDYSGHGNRGTIAAPAWVADGLDFDGSSYVGCGSSSVIDDLHLKGGMSIVTSVNASTAGTLDYIAHKKAGQAGYWLFNFRTTALEFAKQGSTSLKVRTAYNVIAYNKKENIALTWDGSTTASNVHIYVNANEVSYGVQTNGAGFNSDASQSLYLCSNVRGVMSYIYIYDTVLTAAQVKFLHDDPYFMFRLPEELYGYAAAAAGVTIPVFLHHYNQMRQ